MQTNTKALIATYVIGALITIGVLANSYFQNGPLPPETYTVSTSHTAPFTRLTIKGTVTNAITTVNATTVTTATPKAYTPISYRWESSDQRFLLIDPDIYTPNNELFTYKLIIGPTGEIDSENKPIESIITVQVQKEKDVTIRIQYNIPNEFVLSGEYKIAKYKQFYLFGSGVINNIGEAAVGIGIGVKF